MNVVLSLTVTLLRTVGVPPVLNPWAYNSEDPLNDVPVSLSAMFDTSTSCAWAVTSPARRTNAATTHPKSVRVADPVSRPARADLNHLRPRLRRS